MFSKFYSRLFKNCKAKKRVFRSLLEVIRNKTMIWSNITLHISYQQTQRKVKITRTMLQNTLNKKYCYFSRFLQLNNKILHILEVNLHGLNLKDSQIILQSKPRKTKFTDISLQASLESIVFMQYNLKMLLISLLLVCAALAHNNANLTDQQKLQKILNGVFEQNRLPHPKVIVDCFDDITARDWAIVVEQSIARAAYGQQIDYYHLMRIIRHVGVNTPLPVALCLEGSDQAISLGQRFGIYNPAQLKSLEQKVVKELALNYREFRKEVIVLNHEIKDGKYFDAGYQASEFVHKLLHKLSLQSKLTDKQILQDLLSGVFRSNNLNGPVTIISCFDDLVAKKFVSKIRSLISEIIRQSKWTSFDIVKAIATIQHLKSLLPLSTKICLQKSMEFSAFLQKYSVQKRGRLSLTTEIITYFKKSAQKAKALFQRADALWSKNQYEEIGYLLSEQEKRLFKLYK